MCGRWCGDELKLGMLKLGMLKLASRVGYQPRGEEGEIVSELRRWN